MISVGIYVLCLSHRMGFAAISHAMWNSLEIPLISHMMEYTAGWESWWKKVAHTLWKVWVPISQVLPTGWVLLDFPMLWEVYGQTHAFLMWWSIPLGGNRMGKRTHTMGKVWIPVSHVFSIRWVLLHFSCDEVYLTMEIGWEKRIHNMGTA